MKNKILNMLGLAQKAGRIASGELAVRNAVKTGKVSYLLIARDASAASRKSLSDMAASRKIPCHVWGTKEELGQAVGKEERSGIAITDSGFAGRIRIMLEEETEGKQGD